MTELTYGQHFGLEHGWWLDKGTVALGVGVAREVGTPMWPNRLTVAVEIGPLTWHLTREWPYGEAAR